MEDIVLTATAQSEILTLKYVLKLLAKYPKEMVVKSLEDYVAELEAE